MFYRVILQVIIAAFTIALPGTLHAQIWTWVHGDSLVNPAASYGTQGVPAPTNVPGSRQGAVSWDAGNGKLYMFGGFGKDANGSVGRLNDLWCYDTATGNWTWLAGSNIHSQRGTFGTRGVQSPVNIPGARQYAAACTPGDGNLYLFGGDGIDSSNVTGRLNDLWRYDTTSGQWTWVSGSPLTNQIGSYGQQGVPAAFNAPGSRKNATAWSKDQHLFLFGGDGPDTVAINGSLNDLWRYDTTTGEWTWLAGSKLRNRDGVYRTKGIPAISNAPGGRADATAFQTDDGNLYMFGGFGFDSQSNYWDLNDLWKYDTASGYWTWVSGSDVAHQNTVFGTRGIPAAANAPGGRLSSHSWSTGDGYLYTFGGPGIDAIGSSGYLNDLWRFDTTTNQWAWVSGAKTLYQFGAYGAKGERAVTNVPGARAEAVTWSPGNGKLYVFGGYGYIAGGLDGRLNDMWVMELGNAVAADTIQPGWQLTATPIHQFADSPAGIFGDDISPLPDVWQFSPSTLYTAATALEPGSGYWIYLNDTSAVDAIGATVDVAQMSLEQGWNLIGNPFEFDCDLASRLRFTDGTSTKTLAEANSASWISGLPFSYNGSAYTAESVALSDWKAYWLYVVASGIRIQYSRTPFP